MKKIWLWTDICSEPCLFFFIPLYERAERRMNMEFLKWYLIIGVIVNIICIIYNVKKYGYKGNDAIKNYNIFVKVMIYCGVFALEVICWLLLVIADIECIIKRMYYQNKND